MNAEEQESILPLVVCELANSHGGKLDAIEALVDAFGRIEYPRKAIKFQVFSADTIALPDFSWYDVYKELEMSADDWKLLISKAAKQGDVWIDVFDRYSTQIIGENHKNIAGLKLQASVLENDEILRELQALDLAEIGVVLNVSGFELSEIHRILARFRSLSASIVLQIGFQAYPTALEDTALQKLDVLRAAFPGMPLGIADHANGSSDFAELAPLYAHLLGCNHIEKHFCIERATAAYDGYSALEPAQMQLLCARLRAVAAASNGPFVNKAERSYLAKSVQIPVLRDGLAAGTRIAPADLLFRRTAQQGISWNQIDNLQQARKLLAVHKPVNSAVLESDFRRARVAVIVAAG